MKRLLLLCIFLLVNATSLVCYGQWIQTNGPMGGNVNCVTRVGAQIWAGAANGIYASADEGATWQITPLFTGYYVMQIFCKGDTLLVIYNTILPGDLLIGFQAYSSTSLDGGTTWSAANALIETGGPATASVYRIKNTFLLSLNVLSDGNLLSYDNGLTWSPISTGFTNSGNNTVTYYNDTATAVAFVQGTSQFTSLYVSTDGLHTWRFIDSSQYYGTGVLVDNNVVVANYSYGNGTTPSQIIRSANYGASWDTVFTSTPPIGIVQVFDIDGVYYAYADSGSSDFVYQSTDKGLTWTGPFPLPTNLMGIPLSNGNYLEVRAQDVYNQLGFNESVAGNYVPSQDSFFITETGINCYQVNQLFSNKNVLFASTDDDLYRSADGGQTWVPTGKSFYPVWDMLFIGDTAFAASTGYVAWSYNNGLTWDSTAELPQNESDEQDFASLAYLNGRVIFASNGFQYTDNYGVTWYTLPIFPQNQEMSQVGHVIVADNALLAMGNAGLVYQFNNNTQAWDSIAAFSAIGAETGCNFYLVEDSVLIASTQFGLVTSTNLFQTETVPAGSGLPYDSSAYHPFVPKNIISVNGLWICSAGQTALYQSSDRGQSWQLFQGTALPFTSNYYIKDLTIMNNVIYSDTYNTGVWRLTDSFSNISGVVFNDLNNNGQRDEGEPGITRNIVYTAPSGVYTSADTLGNYALTSYATGDTIRPALPVFYAGVKPAYRLSTGSSATNQNFGIYIPPNVADLSIDLTNVSPFGWNLVGNQLIVTALNKGSLPQIAMVQLTIDSGLSYVLATPTPNSVSVTGDTLTWLTDTLHLLQSAVFSVTVSSNQPIGSAVVCHAQITPVIHDTMPADNYAVLRDSIIGPFDPNSKTCVQGALVTPQQVANNQELDYEVRFQNDGNAPAVNITIADTISRFFNLSTFHIISSSSPVQFSLQDNVVNFNFKHINLLPKSESVDSSSGFVKYGLTCKTSLNVGNVIANTASIYFDNNPAVVTNTALTGVGFSTGSYNSATNVIYVANQLQNIKVFPNPTSALLNIDFGETRNEGDLIQIYDVTGRLTKTVAADGQLQKIYMDGFADGVYFGRVTRLGYLQAAFRFVLSK